jgi:hypothetical protein
MPVVFFSQAASCHPAAALPQPAGRAEALKTPPPKNAVH